MGDAPTRASGPLTGGTPTRATGPLADPARLLFPAIRWQEGSGFADAEPAIEQALELGVGGWILFGGEADALRELTARLRRESRHPILIGADLERGAGQQFRGATPLPPLAALGSLDDEDVAERAGELTAREALALGVDWVYAPMADIDVEPRNPIVGTRSLGSDPATVARLVAAWIRGCARAGALSCAKHFPGHGRTTTDSHIELPSVDASAEQLEQDLEPFRAAIAEGVDSIMTAHVSYAALDPSGSPATMSRPIVTELLRERLGYDGLVVTDALIMEGALADAGEAEAAVRAVAAGCDAMLYPERPAAVARRLREAVDAGDLDAARLERSVQRIADAARRTAIGGGSGDASGATGIGDASGATGSGGASAAIARDEDRRWADDVAMRTVQVVRGAPAAIGGSVQVVTVDDDVGGPYPPPARRVLIESLRGRGIEVEAVDGAEGPPDRPGTEAAGGQRIIAVYADIRAWKGRPGISERAQELIEGWLDGASLILLFAHPRLSGDLPDGVPVVAAWGGEAVMQRAAAEWLTRSR